MKSDFARHSWSSWSKEGQSENSWGQGRFGNLGNFGAIFAREWCRNDAPMELRNRPEVSSSERSLRPMWGLVPTRHLKINAFACWLADSTNNLSIGFLNNLIAMLELPQLIWSTLHQCMRSEQEIFDIMCLGWMGHGCGKRINSGWHTIVSNNLCSKASLFDLQN